MDNTQIQEHMEIVGSDGQHVGTVDHMEGSSNIKLTKRDPDASGEHHYIPLDWVASVDSVVRLNKSASDAQAQWTTEAPTS